MAGSRPLGRKISSSRVSLSRKEQSLQVTLTENSSLTKTVVLSTGRVFPNELRMVYFCDSRNIVEISRFQLFLSKIFVVILKNADILFASEYKREK